MSGVTIAYHGLSEEILIKNQILEIFDKLWGESNRGFPHYPSVIGGISAFWRSADATKHHVNSIDELIEAYEKKLTYDIHISGTVNHSPRCTFVYIPAKKEGFIQVKATTNKSAEEKLRVVKEMCPKQEKPVVFISYAGDELALADFLKEIILRISNDKLDVFVATRDIRPGAHPLTVMMEEKLKAAQAVVPICSNKSKGTPWVWWEAASVWAREGKIYPLCTNISFNDFGAPLSLVAQGKNYFMQKELIEVLQEICNQFGIDGTSIDFEEEEIGQYKKLQEEYIKQEASAQVDVSFKTIEQKNALHKYSFIFEIENKTRKAFGDLVVMLYFPSTYLEKQKWDYSHLKSSPVKGEKGYVCLTFVFSNLNDTAKGQFKTGLLSQQKLRVFGEGGITNLIYQMDDERWDKRFNFRVHWKVFIDDGAPQEGSIPLDSIQNY